MRKIPAREIQPGDVILPPERGLSLWMRRRANERGLPESALYLTVERVSEGMPDKRGAWVVVSCKETDEWTAGYTAVFPFTFKARPETSWPLVARPVAEEIGHGQTGVVVP